jgi:hypothetical protein
MPAGKPPDALPAPQFAPGADAHEVLRAWVADGGLTVSVRRSFDDPSVWGILLADVARHVSRIYAEEDGTTEEAAMAKVVETLTSELLEPTDLGSTHAVS